MKKSFVILAAIMLSVVSVKAQESMGTQAHNIEALVHYIIGKYVDLGEVKQEFGDNTEITICPFSVPKNEVNAFIKRVFESYNTDAPSKNYMHFLPNEGSKAIATVWNDQLYALRSKYGTEILVYSTYIVDGKYKDQDACFIVTWSPKLKGNKLKGHLYASVNDLAKICIIECEKIKVKKKKK